MRGYGAKIWGSGVKFGGSGSKMGLWVQDGGFGVKIGASGVKIGALVAPAQSFFQKKRYLHDSVSRQIKSIRVN